MEYPVQITFRGIEPTDAIREAVEKRAKKLERFYDKIESCDVVIEAPHRRRQTGNAFQIKIRLGVPGEDVFVSREPTERPAHDDLYLAINDSFKEATRLLQDHVRRRRRLVKKHEPPEIARVARLFPEEGYGFIRTPDGREIYFHENAVLEGGFPKLSEGTEVRFAEEMGVKGPQATTVEIRR